MQPGLELAGEILPVFLKHIIMAARLYDGIAPGTELICQHPARFVRNFTVCQLYHFLLPIKGLQGGKKCGTFRIKSAPAWNIWKICYNKEQQKQILVKTEEVRKLAGTNPKATGLNPAGRAREPEPAAARRAFFVAALRSAVPF